MTTQQKHPKTIETLMAAGKQMTRREFMQRAAILGIGLSTASGLWLQTAQAAEPKKGGNFRLGLGAGNTTDSLDPAMSSNMFMSTLIYARHNHVAETDVNGKLVPEICESWEASPDAKTWRFKIRKGVEFHNGKTLDVKDILASVNHHRHPDSKSSARPLLKNVAEMKSDGNDAFIVKLNGGDANFPYIISDYHIAIMQAKDDGVDWQSGIGAGPYKVDSYEPGVKARLSKFQNYFKPDRGHFDSLEILSIIDAVARTSALKSGVIDAMERCDLKTVHLLKRTPGIRIKNLTGYAHYTLPMNCKMAPFDNNDVRLALKLAVDREAFLKTIMRGYGKVGNDHPISPVNEFYASQLPQRVYDPEKAKYHVKKAGLGKLKVKLHAAECAFAGATDTAVLFSEHAKKAGIDIEVVRKPNDGFWSNVWMKVGWCMAYWAGRPTEDWMFTLTYAAGAPWNESYWEHKRFNELLLRGRAELDRKKRREIYVEMQSIVRDEGGTLIPMFNNWVYAHTDKLQHGPKVDGSGSLDGGKICDRWWFA